MAPDGGHAIPSLQEYSEAARQSAQESNVPFIDLNTMSTTLYEAPGPQGSKAAFAQPAPGRPAGPHSTAPRPLGDEGDKEASR
jgi:hypothetical protein